jgi:ABC-2 type transport system ATP-binding protein
MLKLVNIAFSWPSRQALVDINLSLEKGEILALLGPNGAGKSTLVRTILGQLKADQGQILLEGRLMDGASADRLGIAWVPQSICLYPKLTVKENLEVFATIMGVQSQQVAHQVNYTLQRIGLAARAKDLAGDLSGGMQRMLNVGIALVSNPSLLILDEPTAGIDQRAREQLHKTLLTLREEGLAILLTTHDLDDAKKLADRLAILVEGQLCADGTVSELIQEHFAGQREVRVDLAEDQLTEPLKALFARFELHQKSAGQWSGLVNDEEDQLGVLLSQLLAQGGRAIDVTVREPGLDMLIRDFIVEKRAA